MEPVDVHGERVLVQPVKGDGLRIWRRARETHPDRYPVLVLDAEDALEPDYRHRDSPADILARADRVVLPAPPPRDRGTGDEGYHLDRYDVAHHGEPELLVLLPRPEPWAAFAYLDSWCHLSGWKPEVLVAAARDWHTRYGAEPTVIGLACGFEVSRPPTGPADAERLAAEHQLFAPLTAGTTELAYARALPQLRRWCLYNRP
ncbi:DUF4253 domain-containing protein [Actinoplanes hulinensis]|uniref:DUF4253 domain-containing protein n=1 Tax=Actinoplanes hulinensis TaxID=1144547 RepID=A0ABS7B4V6_9ACTN|nr:DUF4253 domain-containing protein [Actinoplanes hulinensis]MBW6435912.1 DUF4253 domain-containing protein [Actinoplanes hulinensis]